MRVLFLVQSCEKERYLQEEQIIRETWGKRIRKNCDLIFYRGDGDNTLSGDVLSLKCPDDLSHTFEKTAKAFSVFAKDLKYDFIIRVNTSTWVNVDLLLNTLETWDCNKRELYGGYLVNSNSLPFLRGCFLIFTKQVFLDLMESVKEKYYNGVDDVNISINLISYYTKIGVEFLKMLRKVEIDRYEENFNNRLFNKAFGIRCVEYIKDKNNSDVLYEIDKKYLEYKAKKSKKFKGIETHFGVLKF